MTKWEQHFDKLQHGLTFDENNPDVTYTSENENCNKKLIQNDAGSSQDKSYNRYKRHSLDECVKNMIKKLRAIPKHAINDTGKEKTLDAQPKNDFFFHETPNTKTQNKNDYQNMCLCNQEYIWDLDENNIIDYESWEKCKGHHELCLNYNFENSFSSWADMMEKNLKWNKQQNLDDQNQKATHNIEF